MSLNLEGGIYTGTDLADKVFYGFRLNATTGNLDVEVIDDETLVIAEPEPEPVQTGETEYIIDPQAYKAYVWSRDTMTFSFNPNNGHLHMTYL
jgi:hypothetical protein